MATRAHAPDVHQTCKNIQYRKDLRIEELENENDKLRRNCEEQVVAVEARAASECGKLRSNYAELHGKYQRLRQQIQDCEKWAKEVKEHADQSYDKYRLYHGKYAKSKQAIQEWQTYYEACNRLRAKDNHSHHELFVGRCVQVDVGFHSPQVEDPVCSSVVKTAAHQTTVSVDGQNDAVTLQSSTPPPRMAKSCIASEESTEGGSDATQCPSSPPVKHEPSSEDAPIIVSARCVKRKRRHSERMLPPRIHIKQERKSPDEQIEAVSVVYSTAATSNRWTIPRHQTSDLDALADKLATPRKAKFRPQVLSKEDHKPRSFTSLPAAYLEAPELETVMAKPADLPAQAIVSLNDHSVLDEEDTNASKERVLKDVEVNKMSRRKDASRQIMGDFSRSSNEAVSNIHMLAEDGEDDCGKGIPTIQDTGENQQLRLDSMLEMPSPGHKFLIVTPKLQPSALRPPRTASRFDTDDQIGEILFDAPMQSCAPLPNKKLRRESLPQRQHSTRSLQQPPHGSSGVEKSPPHVDMEDEPLRSRPAASLRLQDFRINPRYMGSDYAWADTLRGRDQRRCLPGCMKPDCCGNAFLDFAEKGAASRSDHADAQALEAYLGPSWIELMGAQSPEKRAQLVIQAHAALLANEFGKHRQAFERRSTPPGFWRTDMPSTQEAERDRIKALEMVREKVEERRREAMRDGGRWLFRDEL
nr:hypothetical protein CFP56_28688 [Quercus suber]